MTQEEKDYIETLIVTLTLAGYKVDHYKQPPASNYKDYIYIQNHQTTIFVLKLHFLGTTISRLRNNKKGTEHESTNIKELGQIILGAL